jgi:phage gp37-like protein
MSALETKSYFDLIETYNFAPVREAIVAEFESLITGVAVMSHPGKLDISDVIAADIKKLPAIMVGWTRQLLVPETAQHFGIEIEFIAYIAVQDATNNLLKKAIKREDVANAIGARLLEILHHEDHQCFGMQGLTRPSDIKPPEFKPIFTSRSYSKGVAYYALTWTQALIDQGSSIATDEDFVWDTPLGTSTTVNDDGELEVPLTSATGASDEDIINSLFKVNEEEDD